VCRPKATIRQRATRFDTRAWLPALGNFNLTYPGQTPQMVVELLISLKMRILMPNTAVFLDRDGVINKVIYRDGKPTSPRNIGEFEFEAGVEPALDRLSTGGFKLFVVTNQPELARGLLTKESLCMMTERILSLLKIEEVRICPHDNDDGCRCRKPQPWDAGRIGAQIRPCS